MMEFYVILESTQLVVIKFIPDYFFEEKLKSEFDEEHIGKKKIDWNTVFSVEASCTLTRYL